MKKLLFLLIACGLAAFSFAQTPVSEERVIRWAAYYPVLVKKDRSKIIQQINMDATVLSRLLANAEGFKLIAAADPEQDTVTVFLQLLISERKIYYNIYDVFNSTQRGMRNKPPLCPPPNGCDVNFKKSQTSDGFSEEDINTMYKGYLDLVKIYPKKAIQQITMDGSSLKQLINQAEGLKLIPAVDLEDASTNMILQVYKNGEFTYSDIRDLFNPAMRGMKGKPPICPPPVGCGL